VRMPTDDTETGGRPIPGGESLLMATKAAWALARLLVKGGGVENEGVKQYPSHRTSSLGGKIEPSRCIGESKEIGGFFILFFIFIFIFYFFLYHIFVVKVQEIAWSASYGENKTQNPKPTNKGNFRHQIIFNWGPYRSQAHIRVRNSNT